MDCGDYEDRILEAVEADLDPAEQPGLAGHLQRCAACREFAARARALEAALSRALHPPAVPASLDAAVWSRIEGERAGVVAVPLAVRRAQAQAEFEAARRRYRPGRLWMVLGLDALGYATLAGLAGYGLMILAQRWAGVTAASNLPSHVQLAWTGGITLAFGIGSATIVGLCTRIRKGRFPW